LSAFVKISEQLGYDFRLLKEVQRINTEQMDRFVKKIQDTLWVLKDKRIGVLGLAFKQNTDDVRLSPAIDLCERLLKEGAHLRVYDPKAMDKARALLPTVTYCKDMNDVAEGCDALVVGDGVARVQEARPGARAQGSDPPDPVRWPEPVRSRRNGKAGLHLQECRTLGPRVRSDRLPTCNSTNPELDSRRGEQKPSK
jgi:hypothetical protein